MDRLWITASLVFFTVVAGTVALAILSEMLTGWRRKKQITKRLAPVLSGRNKFSTNPDLHELVRASAESRGPAAAILAHTPGLHGMGALLEQSRLGWGEGTFLVATLGSAFAFGACVLVLSRSLPLAIAAAFFGSIWPYFYVSRARKRRFKQFEEEFPESIDLLTRAIRAGHPLSSGMQMVAEEGPPEVAMEFRRTFEEQRFGLPFDDALLGMVDRTDLVDVRIFAIAVLIQREVGGNLAEILDNLAHTIRRRFYIRRQLRVYTAQGRMTGYALAALPVALGLIIFLIQPDYIMTLFQSLFGWTLVGLAVFLQLIGGFWIKKIIAIDI
jgi:tight adherence protein B